MRYLLLTLTAIGFLCSCTPPPPCPECPEADWSEFEKNKATLESMFAGFQAKSIDPSIYADDFVDVGTSLNEADRNKAEALEQFQMLTTMLTMELNDAVYLPGIDTANFEMDGSVRYYGKWSMQMGEATEELMAYGSMDFNDEGQMTSIQHYADWTATFGALLQANPEIMAQMNAME